MKCWKEQELTEEMIKVRENKLNAEIAKQADADRYKKEIEAAAEKRKTELDAEAELTLRKRQAEAEAEKLLHDAKLLDEAGCFAIVLEKIPAELAKRVTEEVSCPTIGIGAGNVTDGQVLVLHDMLGLNEGFKPKFLRQFAQLGEAVKTAVSDYVAAVKNSSFPNEEESY
mgnify:CR=1 FL=1